MRGILHGLAFLIALAAVPGWSQTSRGTISGLVLDPQTLAVPAATVELINLDTNALRTSATNEVGLYRFDAVDPGSYKLNVRREGFKAYTVTGLEVAAARVTTFDAPLELGTIQQLVEVRAPTITLQVESPVRGGNIPRASIQEKINSTRRVASGWVFPASSRAGKFVHVWLYHERVRTNVKSAVGLQSDCDGLISHSESPFRVRCVS